MSPLKPLPTPVFIDLLTPEQIYQEMKFTWETANGFVLPPSSPETLMLRAWAYRESLVRIGIQNAALLNLARYSRFPMLDLIGELVETIRLEAQFARVPILVTLSAAQALPVVYPAGSRIQSNDGKVIFATSEDLTIAAGQTTGTVTAVCQTAGVVGNDYLAGEVSTLLDPVAHVATAASSATSTGGFDVESEENLLERILISPEQYSTAGSYGAYRYHALKAHQSITDVEVQRGVDGEVNVYPFVAEGAPSEAILDLVTAALRDPQICPVSDLPTAYAPTAVDYALTANVTLYTGADEAFVTSTITAKLTDLSTKMRAKRGRDVVPSQFYGAIGALDGLYFVELEGLTDVITVAGNAYANCTAITVNVVGVTDG